MSINAHLRDFHGYSLSESVRYAPHVLLEVHEREHQETDCGHTHDERGDDD